MARKKEFQEEEILDRAMETFWQKGYESTSVDDLVQSTGLLRGSLYNAFGDKHGLLQACLQRYDQVVGFKLLQLLQKEAPAKEIIVQFFDDFIDRVLDDPLRKGCFMTNSAVELAPRDSQSSAKVAGYLTKLEEAMYKVVVRAQQNQEISSTQDAKAVASYLISSLQGLRVMAKVYPEHSKLSEIAKVIISVME